MQLSDLELELLKITEKQRLPEWAYRHLKEESRKAFDRLLARELVVLLSDNEYGVTEEGRETVWQSEYVALIPKEPPVYPATPHTAREFNDYCTAKARWNRAHPDKKIGL